MRKYLNFIAAAMLLFLSLQLDAQCLQGDCSNGYGKYKYPGGAIYEGEFRLGKCHGKGILSFSNGNKYLGDWQDNYREGKGKLIFSEGHSYIGGFVQSKMQGKGTMRYINGDKYAGNWENDRPNGTGQYTFGNGNRYEGSFVNGRFDGHGTMFYNDGSRFEGFWKNSKKHGNGTLHLFTGETQYGQWSNGARIDAPVDEIIASSTVTSRPSVSVAALSSSVNRNCNASYCETGLGTYNYSDGSTYKGEFRKGEPEGQGTVTYANGDRYTGSWKNHAPHGRGVIYYQTGRVLGAIFENGRVVSETVPDEQAVESASIKVIPDPAVKIWSVVVGVGRYTQMPVLNYTDDDAYRVYAFLKSPQGGSVPDNQVKLLVDETATRANIIRSMRETLLQADENDVIMFYFSGHGLEGSLLPVDYNGYNNRIHYDEIKNIMEESRAKHKMVFADACYSGGLLAAKSPHSEPLKVYLNAFEKAKGGMAFMMSSRSEEVSLEDGGLRSGVFSYYLIKGLKGEADRDGTGLVTISELFDYVHSKVRRYTSNAQTPTISGNYDFSMPVAVLKEESVKR